MPWSLGPQSCEPGLRTMRDLPLGCSGNSTAVAVPRGGGGGGRIGDRGGTGQILDALIVFSSLDMLLHTVSPPHSLPSLRGRAVLGEAAGPGTDTGQQ